MKSVVCVLRVNLDVPVGAKDWDLLKESVSEQWHTLGKGEHKGSGGSTKENQVWSVRLQHMDGGWRRFVSDSGCFL